jgi:hypothetical protein
MERKQKEIAPRLTERIELRVSPEMMAQVERRAVRDKMSIADVVRAALSGIEETRK